MAATGRRGLGNCEIADAIARRCVSWCQRLKDKPAFYRGNRQRPIELAFAPHTIPRPSEVWHLMSENERRYFELVELARICWRNSQAAGSQEVAGTLRRMATKYLQEAAKLDDGKVPDIGLVDHESGWIDARQKKPARGGRGCSRCCLWTTRVTSRRRPKAVCLGHRAVGRIEMEHP